MAEETSPPARRTPLLQAWAASSIAAGLLWLVFAVAPIPFTSLLGLPFGAYAIVVGAMCLRRSLGGKDAGAAWRAAWGLSLGCAGFIYLLVFYVIAGSVLAAAALSLLSTFGQATAAP